MQLALQKKQGLKREKTVKIIKKVCFYLVLTLIAVYMMLPFYCSIIMSFRPENQIHDIPVKLYPYSFTFENYATFFEFNVFRYIGNTLLVIAMILFFQLLLCCMGGYALAKLKFPGKKLIVNLFFASMMIPGIIALIPQFTIIMEMGLVDSLFGIIVPAMFSIYGCLFMRSFFLGTPDAVAESARIDGAGEFRIFLQLFIPMVIPGLITLGLFTFNGNWNSYLWPSIVIVDQDLWVMAIAIKEFEGIYGADGQGAVLAGAIVTILPSILIFIVGQKYFMENLAFAGIK